MVRVCNAVLVLRNWRQLLTTSHRHRTKQCNLTLASADKIIVMHYSFNLNFVIIYTHETIIILHLKIYMDIYASYASV